MLYELFRADENRVDNRRGKSVSRIDSIQQFYNIPPGVQIITVEDNSCKNSIDIIQLNGYHELRLLHVKSNCFDHVKTVSITDMPKLEVTIVDSASFAFGVREYAYCESNPDISLTIANCPMLHTLVIGEKSFSSFGKCVLSNLPRLQRVEFGKMNTTGASCFYQASLELKSKSMKLPDEQTCRF